MAGRQLYQELVRGAVEREANNRSQVLEIGQVLLHPLRRPGKHVHRKLEVEL